jgi:hypothetical protein
MINPYTLYCIGFSIALVLYALGWSDVYPTLTVSLASFIGCTLILHLALARYWSKTKQFKFYKTSPAINPILVTIFLYALWIADFIYEGGIPLIKILTNKPYDYRLFGVPSLHVFAVTFSSFYILYLFHAFLSERKKQVFFLFLINFASSILIYSRSMFFFNMAGCFFLYLFSLEKFPYRKLILLLPLGIVMFYLFGVVGNKRVSFELGKTYDPNSFLEIGKASQSFRESSIPKEFFWSYIYISSPLANLQANILHNHVPPVTFSRVLVYINNEYLFESISKRVNSVAGIEREKEITIKNPFNVSTIYSRSYSYIGWAGMIAMALFVLVLPLVYYKVLPANNPYALTGFAILCTVYLFLVYDNTIRLMALGFQLVYPLVFPFADKVFKRIER